MLTLACPITAIILVCFLPFLVFARQIIFFCSFYSCNHTGETELIIKIMRQLKGDGLSVVQRR